MYFWVGFGEERKRGLKIALIRQALNLYYEENDAKYRKPQGF